MKIISKHRKHAVSAQVEQPGLRRFLRIEKGFYALPNPYAKLIDSFSKLPGIGIKTATVWLLHYWHER